MKLDWGKSIFLFFIVFISLGIVFIVFSFKHKPELVTDNYYEEGAAYTQQMNTNKRSVIFQDSVKITQNSEYIILNFGEFLKNEIDSLNIHFYCPSDKEKDYINSYNLVDDSLTVSTTYFSHGRYFVKIHWQMKNEVYYLKKDIFIK